MTSIFKRLGQPSGLPRDRAGRPIIREAMEAVDAAPTPQPSTLVGGVVANINRALQQFRNQETILIAECTAKAEALRQTRAAIRSMESALTQISEDPALTDEERSVASAPTERIGAEFAAAIDAETLAVANG